MDSEEKVTVTEKIQPAPDDSGEKLKALQAEVAKKDAEIATKNAENDDLKKRVEELEAKMKEAEARNVLEKAVAGGKLTKEAVEAAGSPWFELAMKDARLAERIIETLPAKAGNDNRPVDVKQPKFFEDEEEAKLAKARELMAKEGIDLFAALERIG